MSHGDRGRGRGRGRGRVRGHGHGQGENEKKTNNNNARGRGHGHCRDGRSNRYNVNCYNFDKYNHYASKCYYEQKVKENVNFIAKGGYRIIMWRY
jgi:hypothetical protein